MSPINIKRSSLALTLLWLLSACRAEPTPTLAPTSVPPVVLTSSPVAVPSSPTPTSTLTPTPTPTPSPTPTPIPLASAWLEAARHCKTNGDLLSALSKFRQLLVAPNATEEERQAALLGIGEMELRIGAFKEAEESLNLFLERYPPDSQAAKATFWLAQARQGQMDWEGSIEAFQAYLAMEDMLTSYVSDMIADSYLALGEADLALEAYETALMGAATTEKVIAMRERLAQAYLAAGQIDAAIAQYDAISALADDDRTLARMDYLAGYALMISGHIEEGVARYLHAVHQYPAAYHSYLALIELVDLGHPVDDFARGLVDYHAGAYIPAISAFYRHIEDNLYDHTADGHLYIARCYASIGNYPAALAELEVVLETHQGDPLWDEAWLEQAVIQEQADDIEGAADTYEEFANAFPTNELAPVALWRGGRLLEEWSEWDRAYRLYHQLVSQYPRNPDSSEALYRAGLMVYRSGQIEAARQDWDDLIANYPTSEWVAPALIWLLHAAGEEEGALSSEALTKYETIAASLPRNSYYAIRAADLVSGVLPFEPPVTISWPADEAADRLEAEEWLKEWLRLKANTDLAGLSPEILSDSRWQRGRRLWELGLLEEARVELDSLRYDLRGDAIASYQLALAFREIGLYRSSILAAHAVISLSLASTPLDVPRFIAMLSYPVYYLDLVQAASIDFGVDPLLLFSMIRQESLFEPFARSWAAAQGLMQVIPSTGAEIASQLGCPDYRNEDLYRPIVSIQFGAYYISQQLEAFGNRPYVALSAYNAGPGNAARWYELGLDSPDLYLEIITLDEPKRYIQLIYSHYTMYRALYGVP